MPLNYRENHIKWTYLPKKGPDPSKEDLTDWDETLFKRYEDLVVEIMPDFEIVVSPENKSTIVMLSLFSRGQGRRTKVTNACRYFALTRALDLSLP